MWGVWLRAGDASWTTIKIDGREYVPLSEISDAYEMVPMPERADSREVGISSDERSLVAKVNSREALINGVRHWLSFPAKLGEDGLPSIARADLESTVLPAFFPGSVKEVTPVKIVVLDPGHGGHDKGAASALGLEKDYALDTVKRLRRLLEAEGIKVVQTRLGDTFIPLQTRPSMIKNYEDPIFVSIHLNSAGRRAASGFEVFAYPPLGAPSTGQPTASDRDLRPQPGNAKEPASLVLANTVHHAMLGNVAGYDRGVKRARFSVLRNARSPAILVEGGFLSNPRDAVRIASSQWREHYAKAVAEGIMAYIKLANEGVVPPSVADYGRDPTDEFVPPI
ncbi:hypothetical protein BH23VER1_BH23VER1_30540 [soil metagenome]